MSRPLTTQAMSRSYLREGILDIPNGISGPQYIHVWTDTADDVYEFEANNNNILTLPIEVMLAPSADLQVTAVAAPIRATAGTAIAIDWIVTNHGDLMQVNWQDSIYLSADAQWDATAILIEAFDRPSGLDHGDSYQQSRSVVIPPHLPTVGNYTWSFLALYAPTDRYLLLHSSIGIR